MKQRTKTKIAKLKKEKKRKMIQEAFSGNLSREEIEQRRNAAAFRFYQLLGQAEPVRNQLEQLQQQSADAQREIRAYDAALFNAERAEQEQQQSVPNGRQPPTEPVLTENTPPAVTAGDPVSNVVSMKKPRKKAGH
jgi:hypothetical protein